MTSSIKLHTQILGYLEDPSKDPMDNALDIFEWLRTLPGGVNKEEMIRQLKKLNNIDLEVFKHLDTLLAWDAGEEYNPFSIPVDKLLARLQKESKYDSKQKADRRENILNKLKEKNLDISKPNLSFSVDNINLHHLVLLAILLEDQDLLDKLADLLVDNMSIGVRATLTPSTPKVIKVTEDVQFDIHKPENYNWNRAADSGLRDLALNLTKQLKAMQDTDGLEEVKKSIRATLLSLAENVYLYINV